MDSVDRLLKTIRGVSKTNPVTNLQLSEIIRRLWSDQGKIIQIIYNEIINNTSNIYQSITQIILNEKSIKITQTAHGFSVGDVIKPADPLWVKAKADTEANAKATAVVSEIIDVNNFIYLQEGLVAGDYIIGAKYFLSITTAGAMFVQSDPEVWTASNYRQMIGTGTADGLLVEIDEGEVIKDASIFQIDFIFDAAGTITYPCAYALKFTAMIHQQANAPTLSHVLNTDLAQYTAFEMTADAAGIVTLTGQWL